MKPDAAENRIKIVEDLIWQRVLAEKTSPKRSCSIAIYKCHRDESGLTAERFHDALMAVVDAHPGITSTLLTDSDEFLQYEFGATANEPYLYLVEVKPSWRNYYRKKSGSTSKTHKSRHIEKREVTHSYKKLSLYNSGDIAVESTLLRIKRLKRDLLSILIQNAPHVCTFDTLRMELGSSATNKSFLKYRDEIDDILSDSGLPNAIHACGGLGLRVEY